MKRLKNIFVAFLFVGGLFLFWWFVVRELPKEQEQPPPAIPEETNQLLPPEAQAAIKVIVGANPMIAQNRKFSPPTNSVAISNEDQLRLLIEAEKK